MATVVKVNREGVVTRDGETIGHVKKEMRQGLFATALGVSYGTGDGTPWWIPFAGDGTQLSDGYDTRKKAVERIDKHTRPTEISHLEIGSGWLSDAKFVSASVRHKGFWFSVSRYADEPHWVVDAMATPDSIMPVFSNGGGTRVTSARVLSDEYAVKVTEAATAAGLWPLKVEAA